MINDKGFASKGEQGIQGIQGVQGNTGSAGSGAGSETSNGLIAGAVINGVATLGLGIASAIMFTQLSAQVAGLIATVTGLNLYTEDLDLRIRIAAGQITTLKRQVLDLQTKTTFINRNQWNTDLLLQGSLIQEVNSLTYGQFKILNSRDDFVVNGVTTLNDQLIVKSNIHCTGGVYSNNLIDF